MLACLVVISGWVHSYVCSDSLLYTHKSQFLKIYSQTGRAMIHWSGGWPGASFGLVTESHPLTAGYPDSRYFLNSCTHRLGSFGLFHGRIGFNKANSARTADFDALHDRGYSGLVCVRFDSNVARRVAT